MHCSMTGRPLRDSSEGIYDDGEWVSWEWINGQLYQQELAEEYPQAKIEIIQIFEDLVNAAIEYKNQTDRYLQIWGELGELYAEIKFGIKRHKPGTQGSDGKLGNDWIEVKTISPEKGAHKVQVKRTGNFNKLLVVKINQSFEFEAKIIDRKLLAKGNGKHASISWSSIPNK